MAAGWLCFCCGGLSWAAIGFVPGQTLDADQALAEARGGEAPAVPRGTRVGDLAEPVEFLRVRAGSWQGVGIPAFELSKTLVTVEQYNECVRLKRCAEPDAGGFCNWKVAGRERHPINCVDWEQANQFAEFEGARLPTISEWEYAASGEGKDRTYPWGDEPPTCDRAVIRSDSNDYCGEIGTRPVCSKPAGNAKLESGGELCDMAGNVWEWMRDGGHQDGWGWYRTFRGGSWSYQAGLLVFTLRHGGGTDGRWYFTGFRLARTPRAGAR